MDPIELPQADRPHDLGIYGPYRRTRPVCWGPLRRLLADLIAYLRQPSPFI